MPFFVIGSVVLGIVTATESAGIGAFYAFLVGLIILRKLKLKELPQLFRKSIRTSADVMIIIALSKI